MATNNKINWNKFSYFNAYLSADIGNITGDGTVYSIAFNAEVFDINNDFAAGVFVAPVAGIYTLKARVKLSGFNAAHTLGVMSIYNNTTAANLARRGFNPAVSRVDSNECTLCTAKNVLLAAGDTISVRVNVNNSTKIVDLVGVYTCNTFFGGHLVYRT